MRRILFLFVMLFILFSISATSFGFGVVWNLTNDERTNLIVRDILDSSDLTSKAVTPTSDKQDVCLIKYTTNKGGLHTISFKATPLINGEFKTGYTLTFNHNSTDTTLVVGNTEELYPIDTTVATIISVPFGRGDVTSIITVSVSDIDVESAVAGDYTATITIERITT